MGGIKKSVLSLKQIADIKNQRRQGISLNKIGKVFGVSKSVISYWTNEEYRKKTIQRGILYHKKHPEIRKTTYARSKLRAMNLLGGAVCKNCGCDEIKFLEFNHINGGGCRELRTSGYGTAERILGGKRSVDGMEVLCRVCNALDYLRRKDKERAKFFNIKWK